MAAFLILVLGLGILLGLGSLILGARDLAYRLSMASVAKRLPEGRVRLDDGREVEMRVDLHNHNGSTRRALVIRYARPPGPVREQDPELAELLRRTRHFLAFQPSPGAVTLVWSQWNKPEKKARWGSRIADALAQASPWNEAARDRGLAIDRSGRISGALNGFRVFARATDEETQVRAQVQTAVRAVHVDHDLVAEPTGNPVLDQLARVSGPIDPHDTEVVEALLAVVHGHPGSRVDAHGVNLVAQGAVEDVGPLLDAAVRLAGVLQRG